VTDWNGDGQLDLLVGDMAYLKPPAKELTGAEKQQHETIREQIKPIQKRRREIIEKFFSKNDILNKADRKLLSSDLKALNEQLEKLQSQLPTEIEDHGWVWLFLRKPVAK
jgi:small-conductance mechanosensitive channel